MDAIDNYLRRWSAHWGAGKATDGEAMKKRENEKGDLFESIIREMYRASREWDVMENVCDQAHTIDFMVINRKTKKPWWVDAKAYPATTYTIPGFAVTGINFQHFVAYEKLASTNDVPIFLLFGDHERGVVYGNEFEILRRWTTYPDAEGKRAGFPQWKLGPTGSKVYWPIEAMKTVFTMTEAQRGALEAVSKLRRPPSQLSIVA